MLTRRVDLQSGRTACPFAHPSLCLPPRSKPLLIARSRSTTVVVRATEDEATTRQFRRTVYDFAAWKKHRDIGRYWKNVLSIPNSRIIRALLPPISLSLGTAAILAVYESLIDYHVFPDSLPRFTFATAEPQGLTSFALSLLLVFRTNSSYGRFDEARKIWGGILNRCRHMGNQAVTFIPPEDAAGREAVGKWIVGFCQALRGHLQEETDLRAELKKCQPAWTEAEIDMLVNAPHRPIKAISVLSELTKQLDITHFQALQMQENVQFFYDALGGCERLLRTPIPVSYTRHTSRFLTLWLSFLPFGLWERYHWSMFPVILLVGFLLLGIDEIGVQIEEPFGILPLDVISKRAETDVVNLIKDDTTVVGYVAAARGSTNSNGSGEYSRSGNNGSQPTGLSFAYTVNDLNSWVRKGPRSGAGDISFIPESARSDSGMR